MKKLIIKIIDEYGIEGVLIFGTMPIFIGLLVFEILN